MTHALRSSAVACAALALLLTATVRPVSADPPAAVAPSGSQAAHVSFERFARAWMEKLQRAEAHNRQRPKRSDRGGAAVTYRGYTTDFGTELRPTGHPTAPYVGILRYKERLYACSDAQATRCSVATSTPVTELFRYQDGRWIY